MYISDIDPRGIKRESCLEERKFSSASVAIFSCYWRTGRRAHTYVHVDADLFYCSGVGKEVVAVGTTAVVGLLNIEIKKGA